MSFIQLGEDQSVVTVKKIIHPGFEGNVDTIKNFYTTPSGIVPGFTHVYAKSPASNPTASVQFSIAYGDKDGNGSWGTSNITRSIYRSFRSLLYGSEDSVFNFGLGDSNSNYTSPNILVISLALNVYRQAISAGSLTFTLKNGNNTLTLTDLIETNPNYIGSNKYSVLVKGSNGVIDNGATRLGTSKGAYGMVFADMGLIVLNVQALALSTGSGGIGLTVLTSNASSANNNTLQLLSLLQGNNFTVKGEENRISRKYYIRVPHNECNYTSNPTAVDNSGNLLIPDFVESPESFITSIGLYNRQNELLLVATPSHPIPKRYDEEVYFTIEL